jgi:hypothetical protein
MIVLIWTYLIEAGVCLNPLMACAYILETEANCSPSLNGGDGKSHLLW